MTHLTDYSYLERGMAIFIFGIWAVVHIWSTDKFRVFRWENYQRRDTKTIVTTLLFISMTFSFIYDILGTYVKYAEGFQPKGFNINGEPNCVIRPKSTYSEVDKVIVTVRLISIPFNFFVIFQSILGS